MTEEDFYRDSPATAEILATNPFAHWGRYVGTVLSLAASAEQLGVVRIARLCTALTPILGAGVYSRRSATIADRIAEVRRIADQCLTARRRLGHHEYADKIEARLAVILGHISVEALALRPTPQEQSIAMLTHAREYVALRDEHKKKS